MGRGVLDDRALGALVQVVGDHRAIALAQGRAGHLRRSCRRVRRRRSGLALERGESRVDLAVLEISRSLPSECTSTSSIRSVSRRFRLRSTERRVCAAEKSKTDWPSTNSSPTLLTITQCSRWPRSSGPRRSRCGRRPGRSIRLMPRSRARASRSAASRSSGMVKPEGYFTPWSRPNLTVPRPSGETARPVSPSGRCRSWRYP